MQRFVGIFAGPYFIMTGAYILTGNFCVRGKEETEGLPQVSNYTGVDGVF